MFIIINKLILIKTSILVAIVTDVKSIEVATHVPLVVDKILNETRRIINGEEVRDGRAYMVSMRNRKLKETE